MWRKRRQDGTPYVCAPGITLHGLRQWICRYVDCEITYSLGNGRPGPAFPVSAISQLGERHEASVAAEPPRKNATSQTKKVMADRAASVHSPFHRVPRSVSSTLLSVSSFILRFHVHTTTPPNSHNDKDCHTGSPATFLIPQNRRRTIPTVPVFASVRLEKGCALELRQVVSPALLLSLMCV